MNDRPETATIADCAAVFEASFEPSTFQQLDVEAIAEQALRVFQPFGIVPSSIALDRGDSLFSFSLNISLFNQLVQFSLTADRLRASFRNLRTSVDRDLAVRCFGAALGVEGLPKVATAVSMEVLAHAALPSDEIRDAFLAKNAKEGFDFGGLILYQNKSEFSDSLRFQLDKSLVVPMGLFLAWRVVGGDLRRFATGTESWNDLFSVAGLVGLSIIWA